MATLPELYPGGLTLAPTSGSLGAPKTPTIQPVAPSSGTTATPQLVSQVGPSNISLAPGSLPVPKTPGTLPVEPYAQTNQLFQSAVGPPGPTLQTLGATAPVTKTAAGTAPPPVAAPTSAMPVPKAPGPVAPGPQTGAPTPGTFGQLPNMDVAGVRSDLPPQSPPGTPINPEIFDQKFDATLHQMGDKETVAGQLGTLLDKGNPLMVQAAENAKRMAAGRGLQNSSIAAQAGQQALISSALPIAQQDAAANLQSGLANQQAQNAFGMSSQQFTQNMALAKQKFGFDSSMSDQDAYQQLQKLAAEGDQKAKLALLDYGFSRDMATLQGNIAKDRANQDFGNQMILNAQSGDIQSKLQLEKFGFDSKLSVQDNLNRLQQLAAQGDINAGLQMQQFQFQSMLNDQQNGFELTLEDTRFQNNQNMLLLDYAKRGALSQQEAQQAIKQMNIGHQNALEEIAARATAEGGANADAAGRAMQQNYLIAVSERQQQGSQEIAQIYQTEGLTPAQQDSAVKNAYARMQQDMVVIRNLYSQSPLWDADFGSPTPGGTPAPGGPTTPTTPTNPNIPAGPGPPDPTFHGIPIPGLPRP